jgi:hypothetical protein
VDLLRLFYKGLYLLPHSAFIVILLKDNNVNINFNSSIRHTAQTSNSISPRMTFGEQLDSDRLQDFGEDALLGGLMSLGVRGVKQIAYNRNVAVEQRLLQQLDPIARANLLTQTRSALDLIQQQRQNRGF